MDLEGVKAWVLKGCSAQEGRGALEQVLALEASLSRPPSALRQLADTLCVQGALKGDQAGFSGATLIVRPAAPGAEWLGDAAPPSLEDDPHYYSTSPSLALPSAPARPPAPCASLEGQTSDTGPVLPLTTYRPRGYRCLADAVAAASNGDHIVLLPGTHPTGSKEIHIDKRIIVCGQAGVNREQVVLDHRANHPVFRVSRGGIVLQGFKIDMVGFREAVRFEGPSILGSHKQLPCPLLMDVDVRCSGGDAIVVKGNISPLLYGCNLQGCKYTLRVLPGTIPEEFASPVDLFAPIPNPHNKSLQGRNASPQVILEDCKIQGGDVGIFVCGYAAAKLEGCHISCCGHEGVVVTDRGNALMHECSVKECGGPGIDGSGASQIELFDITIKDCGGGLWLWGCTSGKVLGEFSHIKSLGKAPASLVQGQSVLRVQSPQREACLHGPTIGPIMSCKIPA